MPSLPPLPPLLTPYLTALSPSSLTLISSILGATGNWLVLRYLHAALSPSSSDAALSGDGLDEGPKKKVVLVSFLRSWEFWRTEAKRLLDFYVLTSRGIMHPGFLHVLTTLQGLDLARLADKQQFAFVDGQSELFNPPQEATATSGGSSADLEGTPSTRHPLRRHPGPARGRHQPHPTTTERISSAAQNQTGTGAAKKLHFSGRGTAALDAIERDIISVMEKLKTSMKEGDELLLIVDQPDFLLAATGSSMGIGATEMGEWVTGLQQYAHASVLTLAADSPLIHNASTTGSQPATPVETEHAAFTIGMAHRARSVMQLRTLETGAARDVSGVLRISRGGGWTSDSDGLEEKEVLYFVQRDGGVRVFGRGES